MEMVKAKKWLITCAMLSMVTSLQFVTGCGSQQAPTGPKTGAYVPGQDTSNTLSNNKPGTLLNNQTDANMLGNGSATGTNKHDLLLAQSIANAVDKVPGVRRAYVFYGGGIAYVTLSLNANRNPSTDLTSSLKSQVTNIVKKQDKNIHTVLVTADPDAYHHFQRYVTDINNGRPVSGLVNQLYDVIHRVWPSQS